MASPTWPQRREIYIDARNLQSDSDSDNPLTPEEYAAALTTRGREKLAEHQLVRSFSAEVRTYDPTYPYGEDFQRTLSEASGILKEVTTMPTTPRIWTREDIPTVPDTVEFLDRVQAVRNVFPGIPDLPEVPPDMEHFTYQEANDIERILARIGWAADSIKTSRVYSGEFQAGGG